MREEPNGRRAGEYGTVEAAVSALEQGAFDFLTKPCDDLEMKFKILNALEMKRLKTRIRGLEAEVEKLKGQRK